MKTNRPLPTLVLIVALLSGCALFQPTGKRALVGSWHNSLGTVWTLKDDGTFSVDLNKDNKPDAWGKYAVSGDQITISEASGKVPKACNGPGVYHFKRTGSTLRFTLVSDKCKLRIKNVLLDWTKK